MRRLLLSLALLLALTPALPAQEKPNLVIILADDLGYGDLSCYGATQIKTPNIDRLAAEGVRFTDAHSAASICSPARYGLLSGRSPWRLGKKGNDYRLEQDRLNIASLLKVQGYRSAAIGKWHLGYSKDWNKPPITGPLEVGFDYHFGVPQNHNDHYRAFIENHDLVGRQPGVPFQVVKGQDFPDGIAEFRVEDQVDTTLTAKATGFIRENKDRPFFLYLTLCAPHTHVTPAAAFRGSSQAGLFGDHIQELDAHVGKVLSTLEELGLTKSTLVIFSSDNGSTPNDFKGTQKTKLNLASEAGGVREKARFAKRDARALGHMTNGPWHDGKGTPFEGGHRIPFIARWPGHIPPGTTSAQTLCHTDLLATTAAIIGAELPQDAGEDSFNLLPALLDPALSTPIRLHTIIQGDGRDNALALRSGPWKLIQGKTADGQPEIQLYDLTQDPGETTDISAAHPKIVQELSTAIATARKEGRTRK